jgi:ABC-type Zn uptake system ZnuABC Zn-binding protein ZnuA
MRRRASIPPLRSLAAGVLLGGLVTGLAVFGHGCSRSGGSRISATATLFPVGDWVQRVGGPDLDVVVILPPGASPHGFEPPPDVARRVSKASIHFLVGLGLDDWIEPFLESVGSGSASRVRLGERIDVASVSAIATSQDPHLWMDPSIARLMVLEIGVSLAAAFPGSGDTYTSRAEAYADTLRRFEAELREILAPCRGTPVVAEHGVWERFAERFGLEVAGTIEPYPGREPSAKRLDELTRLMKERRVPVILVEAQASDRTARVLALESGAQVLRLDPIGGSPGHESYMKTLRSSALAIAEAVRRP